MEAQLLCGHVVPLDDCLSNLVFCEPCESLVEIFTYIIPDTIEEQTCGVCMEPVRPAQRAALPCMHAYCQECIRLWQAKGHNTCPECRRPIQTFPAAASPPVYRPVRRRSQIRLCTVALKSGARRGQPCGKKIRRAAAVACGLHS